MRLAESYHRVKAKMWHAPDLPKDVFVLIALCLIGLGVFLVAQIMQREATRKSELQIIQHNTTELGGVGDDSGVSASTVRGMYVGSKTGVVYYLPWCGVVDRIKEENKVWFASKEEAEASGRRPAGNCKGI